MIKFNDNNVIVGYIKQLLAEVNLPIDITNLNKQSNRFQNNYNKHININSIYYDSYTHRYLGDYLRYLKLAKGLNLMQMYNCFSNETVDKLKTSFTKDSKKFDIDSNDDNFKCYCIRVLPDTEYTVAISCPYYQMFYVNVDSTNTYYGKASSEFMIKSSSFDKPFVIKTPKFRKSEDKGDEEVFTGSSLNDFRLIIRLPINNNSSITILEGDYRNVNQYTSNYNNDTYYNSCVTNFESQSNLQFKSRAQLLMINSGISFPFADKLIGYLVGNVITHLDTIGDNIKRIQEALVREGYLSSYDLPGI